MQVASTSWLRAAQTTPGQSGIFMQHARPLFAPFDFGCLSFPNGYHFHLEQSRILRVGHSWLNASHPARRYIGIFEDAEITGEVTYDYGCLRTTTG